MLEKQAACFLADAENFRSIDHKIDAYGLKIYQFLFSKIWTSVLFFSIVALHCLAFLEFPSSLRLSSYMNLTYSTLPGIHVPVGVTLTAEGVFLLIILLDAVCQVYVYGLNATKTNPWLIVLFIVMFFSWIDFFVSVGMGERYVYRFRRFLRPVLAIQKSQLMKKVLKSLSKTMADIFSVFLLLILWLVAFSLIAVSIFSGFRNEFLDEQYETFYGAFFTLLVLLTTANNPDAMIKIYNSNRLSFVFFVLFMVVGIFVFMNVLVAVIYNEFRGHVLDSMQTSIARRRLASRAMYEIIKSFHGKSCGDYQNEVDVEVLKRVINSSSICKWRKTEMIKAANSLGASIVDWDHVKYVLGCLDEHKQSKSVLIVPKFKNKILRKCQNFFLSKSFEILGLIVCLVNVIVITVDVSNKFENYTAAEISLDVFNWIFICLYILEQCAKFFAMGYRIYFTRQGSVVDFFITVIILTMKIAETVLWFSNYRKESFIVLKITVWDLPRITNLLILVRAARIVLFFPSLTPIINTLFDIPWRLKSVIGIMTLLFYFYALLGMNIFGSKINSSFFNSTGCGDYNQLDYGGINFNDFFSSLVVLWCLLIVNNWHVFMQAFEKAASTKWAHLFMISWWVVVVIVVMNCVTAVVIEAYTQRKAFYEEERIKRFRQKSISKGSSESIEYLRTSVVVNNSFTFQMLFKNDLIEPTEEELFAAMRRSSYLCQEYPHISHSHYEA